MDSRSEDPHNKLYTPPPPTREGGWGGQGPYCCVNPRSLENYNNEPIVIKNQSVEYLDSGCSIWLLSISGNMTV